MSTYKVLRGTLAAACVAIVSLSIASAALAASPVYICVQEKAGSPVTSGGTAGTCKTKETAVALPSEKTDQETLLSILPHIKYESSGVAGKPTIRFSGVNVQVVNGEGKTESVNGEGNLVIGYDENRSNPLHEQTGSHNLVLGEEQTFTSFGGIDAGRQNAIRAPFATVTGGDLNTASGYDASIGGGALNTAGVLSGSGDGFYTWVRGGYKNVAEGRWASVSGGEENKASSEFSSILRGDTNTASGTYSSVSGGAENTAGGKDSSILGGNKQLCETEFCHFP